MLHPGKKRSPELHLDLFLFTHRDVLEPDTGTVIDCHNEHQNHQNIKNNMTISYISQGSGLARALARAKARTIAAIRCRTSWVGGGRCMLQWMGV